METFIVQHASLANIWANTAHSSILPDNGIQYDNQGLRQKVEYVSTKTKILQAQSWETVRIIITIKDAESPGVIRWHSHDSLRSVHWYSEFSKWECTP